MMICWMVRGKSTYEYMNIVYDGAKIGETRLHFEHNSELELECHAFIYMLLIPMLNVCDLPV